MYVRERKVSVKKISSRAIHVITGEVVPNHCPLPIVSANVHVESICDEQFFIDITTKRTLACCKDEFLLTLLRLLNDRCLNTN